MVESQQTDINAVLSLVQRYARRFIRDPHDAEDLAQDVLLKVMRAYRRNPAISESNDAMIAAWLLMVTRNTAIDMVRAARARERFDYEITDILHDTCMASSDVESDIEAREQIDAALSRLPEKERVLLLLDAQGYSDEEIAERVHTTHGSVKSGLHRARVAIREVAA